MTWVSSYPSWRPWKPREQIRESPRQDVSPSLVILFSLKISTFPRQKSKRIASIMLKKSQYKS